MKQAVIGILCRKPMMLFAGFLVFILIISAVRNFFLPVVEPFGYSAIPTQKLVFGIPTLFVPHDFSGCIVYGARVYPFALAINIATYLIVTVAVSRFGLFQKMKGELGGFTSRQPSPTSSSLGH